MQIPRRLRPQGPGGFIPIAPEFVLMGIRIKRPSHQCNVSQVEANRCCVFQCAVNVELPTYYVVHEGNLCKGGSCFVWCIDYLLLNEGGSDSN